MDLGEFNKERLLEMFPIFRTEGGGVDFDRLKLALGESVDVGKEVFGMRWPGKADSIRLANAPSHGTLSPDEKESVNFDTTQNLIIEGDNLEVLKLLQKSYQGKVKMIYIDPPYNTGNDFVYEDDFSDGIKNYLQQTGQINDEGNRLSTNSETDGRFHSNWLNMMYSRLRLAQSLLADDGLLFMSIDDHEHSRLRLVAEEIFGGENAIGDIAIVNNLRGRSDSSFFATAHESLLVFSKNWKNAKLGGFDLSPDQVAEYKMVDQIGRFKPETLRKRGADARREDVPTLFYPIFWNKSKDELSLERSSKGEIEIIPLLSDGVEGRWRWGKEKFAKEGRTELLVLETNGRPTIYVKMRLSTSDGEVRVAKPKTVWIDPKYDGSAGTREVKALGDLPFDNPKSLSYIQDLVLIGTEKSDIVLDFFAGSGTTAHAVMVQNAKDGGNRKFILVQLPEKVDPESEAARAGFDSIADITKERVRLAGRKIIEESDGKLKLKGEGAVDFGFRVLKLNESNIEDWNSEEASKSPKDLLDALKTTRLKSGRSDQDVVFEVLVKYGIELTLKVEKQKVGKGSIWKVDGGELIVIVSAGLTVADLHSIVKMSPKVVVMLDESFVPESLKTNARAIFKDAKIELKTF